MACGGIGDAFPKRQALLPKQAGITKVQRCAAADVYREHASLNDLISDFGAHIHPARGPHDEAFRVLRCLHPSPASRRSLPTAIMFCSRGKHSAKISIMDGTLINHTPSRELGVGCCITFSAARRVLLRPRFRTPAQSLLFLGAPIGIRLPRPGGHADVAAAHKRPMASI